MGDKISEVRQLLCKICHKTLQKLEKSRNLYFCDTKDNNFAFNVKK